MTTYQTENKNDKLLRKIPKKDAQLEKDQAIGIGAVKYFVTGEKIEKWDSDKSKESEENVIEIKKPE